ncbi:MAG TPA: lipocalin-like domain-containing protein, partial [Bryobacteraceae bacterium]|nr:lipocalin-like domain-containing protein [Bryobacteraceae bacterium]
NLRAPNGHRFGYELTFFSQAVSIPKNTKGASDNPVWRPDRLYLAHVALSDIDGQQFYHSERLNRAGPGLAGADLTSQAYWNGNWRVQWKSLATGEQKLQAISDRFTLDLNLSPVKPLVINGKDGISRKGSAAGEASHYLSFTRLASKGQLKLNGATFPLTGVSWMDHEFFTEPASDTLAGWDWFAIQLENNEELMLYRLRTKSGQPNPFSSATFVDSRGVAHYLDASQFHVSSSGLWESPHSKTRYPLSWQILIPSLDLQLSQRTELRDQELFTPRSLAPSYWEGAVAYAGRIHGEPVKGVGYLEMTGYGRSLRLRR